MSGTQRVGKKNNVGNPTCSKLLHVGFPTLCSFFLHVGFPILNVTYCTWCSRRVDTAKLVTRRVSLKSDGMTGQTTGHLAACGSASRYMARRKAMRQATELTAV